MEVVMDLRVRTWPMRSSLARRAVRAGSSSSCCALEEEEAFLGAMVVVRWRDEGRRRGRMGRRCGKGAGPVCVVFLGGGGVGEEGGSDED